jgi:hypothetical protein
MQLSEGKNLIGNPFLLIIRDGIARLWGTQFNIIEQGVLRAYFVVYSA